MQGFEALKAFIEEYKVRPAGAARGRATRGASSAPKTRLAIDGALGKQLQEAAKARGVTASGLAAEILAAHFAEAK